MTPIRAFADTARRPGMALAALALAAGLCGAARAQDCLLETPATLMLPRYHPGAAPAPLAWPVKLRGMRGCQAQLLMDNLQAPGRLALEGASASAPLQFTLATQASGGAPVPLAPAPLATLTLAAGQETQLLLWLRPDAAQWVEAGIYQHTLGLRLIRPDGAQLDYRETRLVSEVQATARAQFGAASGGASVARLNFDELQQGAQRSATLDVLANAAHTLSLSSSGQGQLINRQNPGARIAWTLRINGQPVPLGAGPALLASSARGRVRYLFEAQIGAVERVLAGDYADDLLITLTAQ
jgi:hypothetical protein